MANAQVFSGKRILFCDDDPYFAEMGSSCLEGAGLSVTLASNGQEALAYLGREPFDMVVLDLNMPGISGFTVLEEIRGTEATKTLPVMVVTGNDDHEAIERAFNLCANSFMAKPFDWSLLVHQVFFVLKSARLEAELRSEKRAAEVMRKAQKEFVKALMEQTQAPLAKAMDIIAAVQNQAPGPISSEGYSACFEGLAKAVEDLSDAYLRLEYEADTKALADGIEEEEFYLAQCISSVAMWLDGELGKRDVQFMIAYDVPDRLRVKFDQVLLAQAMKNVLGYVLEQSQAGSTIELRYGLRNSGDIVISVGGHGKMAEVLPELKADASIEGEGPAKDAGEALHFSLGMAQSVAAAHGGRLWIDAGNTAQQALRFSIPQARLVEQTDPDLGANSEEKAAEVPATDIEMLQADAQQPAQMQTDVPEPVRKKFGGGDQMQKRGGLKGRATFGTLSGRRLVKSG